MTQDPSAVPICCHASLPVPVGTRRRGREQVALVEAMGVAIADVEQHRADRREGQLAEAFVPRPLVVGQLAVAVGAVLTGILRTIERRVEIQPVGDDRAADVAREPVAVLLEARRAGPLQRRHHPMVHQLPAELAGVAVGARLADRIDAEPARAIEIHRPRAAAHRRHLRDVVRRRLRRERAEQRQRHVHAVEVVDVVLAAAARAGAARRVLRVLHAGNQLEEVAVLLADRQRHDLRVRHAALERRRVALHQRRGRGDGHRFADGGDAQLDVDRRFLTELDLGLPRHRLHAAEHEGQREVARRKRRQPVLAEIVAHGDARRRQHLRARFDGDAGEHATIAVGHLAADRSRLLRDSGARTQEQREEKEHTYATYRSGSHPVHLQVSCKASIIIAA